MFGPHCEEVIITNLERRGTGEPGDPSRQVTQVYTKSGALVAENDSYPVEMPDTQMSAIFEVCDNLNIYALDCRDGRYGDLKKLTKEELLGLLRSLVSKTKLGTQKVFDKIKVVRAGFKDATRSIHGCLDNVTRKGQV